MARASVAPRADGSRDAVGTSSALPPANQRLVSGRDHEPEPQPSPSPYARTLALSLALALTR